jgi:hypothetical protein
VKRIVTASCMEVNRCQLIEFAAVRRDEGGMGSVEFKQDDWMDGAETWWKDSDGIDPGVPGCPIGTNRDGHLK